jgi:mannose-6-phosphate isomerase-like protein (cupin superfamily)
MQYKAVVLLLAASLAIAQSPDPGVTPVRLLDRPEIRVSRVEIQPGAVRSTHTHDDVKFHVWVALTGKLEVTIGTAKPVLATENQAFFMLKGTPHGFRNVGTTPGAVMEIFVKDMPPAKDHVAANSIDIEALLAAFRN